MADFSRTLPFNAEAEQWVIGSILIDNSLFGSVYEIVKPDDFYINDNKIIFSAMSELSLANKDIDLANLTNVISGKPGVDTKETIEYEQISDYLKTIVASIPNSFDALNYAEIVKGKSLLRKLIAAADEIQNNVYLNQSEPQEALNFAEQTIYDISMGNEIKDFVKLSDAIVGTFNVLDKLKNPNEREKYLGLKSGISDLDNTLIGMSEGDLIILGARPGMGKTSLALNIATNVAKQGKTVCIFSLEMSSAQIASRMLSSEALVESNKLRSGNVTENDLLALIGASSKLSPCNIYIDDTTGITVSQMKSKIRRLKSKVDFVVIDYLQLLQSDKKIDNRVQEVSEITRNMKLMAKDLGIPVLCCAQLSRSNEKKGNDKRPILSDLRESGSIEQDADAIMLLYSAEYYSKEARPDVYDIECNIAKNRHGETRIIPLKWMSKFTKFTSSENRYGDGK